MRSASVNPSGPRARSAATCSGSGGFPLFAESLLPIVHDANTPQGRESLNLNTSTDAVLAINEDNPVTPDGRNVLREA